MMIINHQFKNNVQKKVFKKIGSATMTKNEYDIYVLFTIEQKKKCLSIIILMIIIILTSFNAIHLKKRKET